MAAHAVLGASSSKRWMSCPGSVKAHSGAPSGPSSPHAEKGTAAHTLGEWCLEKMVDPSNFKGEIITTDEGNTFVVDEDMITAVRVYYEVVKTESLKNDAKIDIEKKFDLSWLHPGMFGTNDASFAVPFGDLYVYDYKNGYGIVEAKDNTQMLYYAIGASYDVERGEWHDYEYIHMTIVQPNAHHEDGPVRRWTISMKELQVWAKVIKVAAIATEAFDAPLVPSTDACRYCNAAPFCKAIEAKAKEVGRVMFSPVVPEGHIDIIDKMSLEDCVNVVNHKGLLKEFVASCEWRLNQAILKDGKKVEGMKIIRGRGSRDWVDKNEAQRKLSQTFSMDKIMDMEIKSPAQLEKIVGKKIVKDLVYKREGALKVAPLSASGKEIIPTTAKELFSKV